MTDLTPTPATTLDAASRTLDFNDPLESGDPRWVDLSPARGNNVLHRLRKRLLRKQPGRYMHVVFASHRGAGKTTELNRLRHDLSEKFCCLYFEANVELDAYDIIIEDLLLLLCREVERFMREAVERPLPDEMLADVSAWFAEKVSTTTVGRTLGAGVEASVGAAPRVPFIKLLGGMTAHAKVASEHRDELREVLKKYPGSLDAAVNRLLAAAHRQLKEAFGKELLIIIDNLDRYLPEKAEKLLIGQADRLCQLQANLVLTPPISLHYRPKSGNLTDHFHVEVMPSVKLRGPDDPYETVAEPARGLLNEALARRIDLDRLLPEPAARDALILASGGSIRELLQLTYFATLEADGESISVADVRVSRDQWAGTLRDKVFNNDWTAVLGRIAETKRPEGGEDALAVLFHRLAFKYNGTVWYDVHPLLADLPEVAAGLARRAKRSASGTPSSGV